ASKHAETFVQKDNPDWIARNWHYIRRHGLKLPADACSKKASSDASKKLKPTADPLRSSE
ncbi:MAG: hypothetical protein AAGB04_03175, partial [Pseudomonadota bacterium]